MKQTIWTLMICSALFASCQDDDNNAANNPRKDIVLTKSESHIANSQTDFAFDLFRNGLANADAGNVDQFVVSPLSASFALSMLANGAEGEALQEILQALRIGSTSIADVNSYNQKLTSTLESLDKETRLNLANSLWLDDQFNAQPSYAKAIQENYNGEVFCVDFDKAKPQINNWCEERTNGMIKDFLNNLSKGQKMMLLNALYFNGKWKAPFDKSNTRTDDFFNENGEKIGNADFMRRSGSMRFAYNDLYYLLSLPFGNEAFSMYLILPNEEKTLAECIQQLDKQMWEESLNNLYTQEVNLRLPKFSINMKGKLIEALEAMGIDKVFNTSNSLPLLSADNNLQIGFAQQAISVKVTEEGAEAAAVTGIGGETITPKPGTPFDFFLNRPFLYVIAEKSTGTMLFVGQMTKL